MASTFSPNQERVKELGDNLAHIRSRIDIAKSSHNTSHVSPVLVAVSKYKPASDIQACFENGQVDFGENYVQELVEKAEQLPKEIRWHFIGTLQSNKAKILASISNLHAVQTLTSIKAANGLNSHLPHDRTSRLNVFLQVNTSGETSKSGLSPSAVDAGEANEGSPQHGDLGDLALHVIKQCSRLHLLGLMTIGSPEESSKDGEQNADFRRLREARGALEILLKRECAGDGTWGSEGRLLLSMGMSGDFEAAIKAGSDLVRVGTSIFGERQRK